MRLLPLASITLACALGAATARADNVTFTGFAHGDAEIDAIIDAARSSFQES
jgi:hypothetical protein